MMIRFSALSISHRGWAAVFAGCAGLALTLGAATALDLDRKPTLRSSVVVHSDLVTIGDLFEGAGTIASKAIFRAPDLGKSGTVSASKVIAAAKAAGLYDADAGGLMQVNVAHEGHEVDQDELSKMIIDAAMRQSPIADGSELQIQLDQAFEPRIADAGSRTPARLSSLNYSAATGRFEAVVLIDLGTSVDRQRIRGTATEMVRTLSTTRLINKGEVMTADDFAVQLQPRKALGTIRPPDPSQIIGLAARRPINPGQTIALADFAQPVLVTRGETVTLIYEVPGLVLTSRGQAVDSGSRGEQVSILNQQSKRVVHGVVIGPGRVQVTGGYQTTAATEFTGNLGGLTQ